MLGGQCNSYALGYRLVPSDDWTLAMFSKTRLVGAAMPLKPETKIIKQSLKMASSQQTRPDRHSQTLADDPYVPGSCGPVRCFKNHCFHSSDASFFFANEAAFAQWEGLD